MKLITHKYFNATSKKLLTHCDKQFLSFINSNQLKLFVKYFLQLGAGYEVLINYLEHISMVHEGLKPYQCHLCVYRSARKPDLKKHLASVHWNRHPGQEIGSEKLKPKLYECVDCNSRFSERNQLVKHIESVHEGIKPFHCDECEYKSARKSDLKKHVMAVHERKKSPEKPKVKKVIAWPSFSAGKVGDKD